MNKGLPVVIEDNTLKDHKGRVLMHLKGKGWIFVRYPDMTEEEKEYLLDIFDMIHKEEGEVKDFMGNPSTRESMQDYLNFKDEPKGDLCG